MSAFYAVVPLMVLGLVLLLGMSGCGLDSDPFPGGPPPPTYFEEITRHASLVAYWRLNESSGPVAADSAPAGAHDGTYVNEPLPADVASAAAPGDLAFNQPPPLIASDPESLYVRMNGARVEVPLTDELKTPQFTVLAWVMPQWDPAETGNVRSIVTTRESPDTGEKGWSLTANASSQWEVNICDGTTHQTLADGDVFKTAVTFVALTYDGTTVRSFANAGELASSPAAYVPGTVANLYIGEGRPDLTMALYPFNGLIGEVAYFNTALTQQELVDLYVAATTRPPG